MNTVRIENGFPNEDDFLTVLGSLGEISKQRGRDEIYIRQCPLCKGEDSARRIDGAISYNLAKHAFNCKKCGEGMGWKRFLEALNVRIVRDGDDPDQARSPGSGSFRAAAAAVRAMAAGAAGRGGPASAGSGGGEGHAVAHESDPEDASVACEHHARRLMHPDSRVRVYLEKRGFRFPEDYAENLNEAWVGECMGGWVTFFYRDENGRIRGTKCKNHEGAREYWVRSESGVQDEPYGVDGFDLDNLTATIVEGEIDRETLKRVYGVKNVCSLPNGAHTRWKDSWFRYLAHAKVIYLATDRDEPGEECARKMLSEFPGKLPGLERLARVLFFAGSKSVKDANDALTAGATQQEIREAFETASDPDILSLSQVPRNNTRTFIPSRWQSLDEVFGGGFLKGQITHLAGAQKSGKSLWVLDIHKRLAMRGVRSGFVPLDLDLEFISNRIGMSILGKEEAEFYRAEGEDRDGFGVLMDEAMARFSSHIFVTKEKNISTYAGALSVIERMARRGCELITVEDYLSLSVLLERETKGKSVFLGHRLASDLCGIAMRCNCHIILVNHLKSDERGASASSAYGETQIGAKAQANLYVRPVREDGRIVKTIVHVRDNRLTAVSDVDIPFELSTDRTLIAGPFSPHARGNQRRRRSRGTGGGDGYAF